MFFREKRTPAANLLAQNLVGKVASTIPTMMSQVERPAVHRNTGDASLAARSTMAASGDRPPHFRPTQPYSHRRCISKATCAGHSCDQMVHGYWSARGRDRTPCQGLGPTGLQPWSSWSYQSRSAEGLGGLPARVGGQWSARGCTLRIGRVASVRGGRMITAACGEQFSRGRQC
jgi:hypothetical protein